MLESKSPRTYTCSTVWQSLPCCCAWSTSEESLLRISVHPTPRNSGHSKM